MRFPGIRWHKLPAAGLLLAAGLILIGWRTPPALGRFGTPAPAAARVGLGAPVAAPGRVVGLARMPVHLWQWNPAPSAFYSPTGCGAFATAMALSVFQPARFGSYGAARAIEAAMPVIPLVGGTPESANAVAARAAGFPAAMLDHRTVAELRAAIDSNAPVILLVDPLLGLGRHDVLRSATG